MYRYSAIQWPQLWNEPYTSVIYIWAIWLLPLAYCASVDNKDIRTALMWRSLRALTTTQAIEFWYLLIFVIVFFVIVSENNVAASWCTQVYAVSSLSRLLGFGRRRGEDPGILSNSQRVRDGIPHRQGEVDSAETEGGKSSGAQGLSRLHYCRRNYPSLVQPSSGTA